MELHELYKLRVDVFVHEQQTPYAEIDDTDAHSDTRHILVWRRSGTDKELMGVARVFPTEDAMVFGRLVVKPEFRGTGLSNQLIRSALTYAFENFPGKDVTLEAQAELTGFYGAFGFVPEGALYDDTGAPHQKMRMSAAQLAEFVLKAQP